MKSNKGFTLIELLAVIVILAIIALIATPIILDVIDTAKKGAKESSALGYVDAVEKQVMLAEVDTSATKIKAGRYKVSTLAKLKVEVKGDAPSDGLKPDGTTAEPNEFDGVVVIDTKGAVTEAFLEFDSYSVYYDGEKAVANDGEVFKNNKGDTKEAPNTGFCTYSAGDANTAPSITCPNGSSGSGN